MVEVPAGGGPQTTVGTGLNAPRGVAVDAAGDVLIADSDNNRVVEVPAGGGPQTTIGSGLTGPEGVAVDPAGDVFIAAYGDGRVVEVPAGGGPQTTVGTGVSEPSGVAVYAPAPMFTADSPGASATVGTAYSYTYTASSASGEPAAGFRVESGTLPPGLSLNAASGVLSGTPMAAGSFTFTVEAENAADGTLAPSARITVQKGSQTITYTSTAPSDATVGGSYTPRATSSSGLSVAFSIDASTTDSACTITNGVVSFAHAGRCVIDANQAGDSNYSPAPQLSQTVTITSAPTSSLPTAVGTVSPAQTGLTYHLSASRSHANGSAITSYHWTLDGHLIGTGQTITHTFPHAGQAYHVLLTVTDAAGQSASTTITLTPRARTETARITVNFAPHQAGLTHADQRALARLRAAFPAATRARITGYCAAGELSHNQSLTRLSLKRAQAVLAFLTAHHNPKPRHLTLTGLGASHFIATNHTATGRAHNRRVTITITYLQPID